MKTKTANTAVVSNCEQGRGNKLFLPLFIFLILVSTLAQAQWEKVLSLDPNRPSIDNLVKRGNTLFTAADYDTNGVYRSTDDGNTWVQVNNGLRHLAVDGYTNGVTGIFSNGISVFAISTDYSTIYRIDDDGNNWVVVNSLYGPVFGTKGTDILAKNYRDYKVLTSSDNGKTWATLSASVYTDSIANVIPKSTPFALQVTNVIGKGTKIFVGSQYQGMVMSNDDGLTWKSINKGLLYKNYFQYFRYSEVQGIWIKDNYVFINYGGQLYRSDIDSMNWKYLGVNLSSPAMNLAIVGNTIYTITTYTITTGNSIGLHQSLDNGNTWSKINDPICEYSGIQGSGARLLTTDKYIFISTRCDDSVAYGNNIWRNSLSKLTLQTGIDAVLNVSNSKINIYPNPAHTTLTIDNGNYTALAGFSISIKDMTGKEVHQSEIKNPKSEIDISAWAKGSYFVHITDGKGNMVEVRKLIIQ